MTQIGKGSNLEALGRVVGALGCFASVCHSPPNPNPNPARMRPFHASIRLLFEFASDSLFAKLNKNIIR